MTSELLVKRLLKQAGVSVLAGLMMSSAVLAEDISEPVVEHHVEVGITVEDESAGPDVTLDPIEFDSGFEGEDLTDPENGGNPDEDLYTTDLTDPPEPIDYEVLVDPMPEEWTDTDPEVVYHDEGSVDPVCIECSGVPEGESEGEPEVVITTVDETAMEDNGEIAEMQPVNGGFEPEHRGNVAPAAPTFARSSGGSDDDTICKPVWTKGIAKIEC